MTTVEPDEESMAATATVALVWQLTGHTSRIPALFSTLTVAELRVLMKACVALTSAAAQTVVAKQVDAKRKGPQ